MLFEWWKDAGGPDARLIATGVAPAVTLPVGRHALELRVTDHAGETGSAAFTVTVTDTLPPTLLWPPNHEMRPVRVGWQAADLCGSDVQVLLVSARSSDPDDGPGPGDGETPADIQGAETGTGDSEISLRAERSGDGPGRVYELHYRAVDASGNSIPALAVVTVPHDLGEGPEPTLIQMQSLDGATARLHWPALEGATGYDVIRGDLHALQVRDRQVSLGTVKVLQRGDPATSTAEGPEDAVPPTGKGFFYLVQSRTATGGTGYGTESCPWPRAPDACEGGCPASP